MELRIDMLRQMDRKFYDGSVFREDEVAHLQSAYGYEGDEDRYHAKMRVVSNYASMEDIKRHVLAMRPELDMRCWSLQNRYGDAVVNVGGESICIPEGMMERLKADHVHSGIYMDTADSWSMELRYQEKEWLEKSVGIFPGYVEMPKIRALLSWQMRHFGGMGEESLLDELRERTETMYISAHDVFGFLDAALAYGRRRKMALYAFLDD